MTIMHVIKADQIRDVCPYCGEKFSEWNVKFHREFQYNEIICRCGKVWKPLNDILTDGGKEGIENKIKK